MNYEHYLDWKEEHQGDLEMSFLSDKVAPEDQPLDDDGPDFMDDHADEFDAYCLEKYDKYIELGQTDGRW